MSEKSRYPLASVTGARKLRLNLATWVSLVLCILINSVHASPVELRVGPSYQYPVIVKVPGHSAVNPIERQRNWLRVQVESYQGWVNVDDLAANPSFNRPHPEQFQYKSEQGALGLEVSYSTEEAISIGANFPMWGEDLSVRFTNTPRPSERWTALEFGGNSEILARSSWKWNAFMGLGVGLSSNGSDRWDDQRRDTQLPLFTISSDFDWMLMKNSTISFRAQIQNALAGNSDYHGALALVWKIRL